jgi:hypothetical protein
LGRLEAVFRHAGSRALYHGLALECLEARQAAPRLELRLAACLLMAGQVPAVVKIGNLAEPLRAMPPQLGWLLPRVEVAGRQVCSDLAQTVKARRPAVAQPASVLPRATVCRQVYLVQMVKVKQLLEISQVLPLGPEVRDRVCLLDLAKLAAQPRQATLDSLRLPVTGHRARVPQLPLVAERSSGFQS